MRFNADDAVYSCAAQAAPDSHIAMLVDEKLKDVVLFNPYLDEVITIDKKGRDNSILALIAARAI